MRSDLQQPQPNGMALGLGKLGALEGSTPELIHQHIGQGGEVHSQLIGLHRRRGGPVGKQVQLLLLDPVLHIPASAVQLLVQFLGSHLPAGQIRGEEARVVPFGQVLRLADHPPATRPAVQGPVGELLVYLKT